jgi:hypothetical protein
VTSPGRSPAPPGWYPDPGGERQWRVWTGLDWSKVTRPYDGPSAPAPLAETLGLVSGIHRLTRYGVAAFLAGLGLVVSVGAHWPGTTDPIAPTLAATLLATALALLAIGSVGYAIAGRELAGRWSPAVLVPGLNVVVVSTTVSHLLGQVGPVRRVAADALFVVIYALRGGAHPYLAVLPALVSLDLTTSLARLEHQLVGATVPVSGAP